jgi:magnesium-transporting ATPase (P-type)
MLASSASILFMSIAAPAVLSQLQVALITAGLKAGLKLDALTAAKPRIASVPFESEHKFMATVHQEGPPSSTNRRIMYVKGAPDRLLPMCRGQLAGDGGAASVGSAGAELAPLDVEFWQRAQEELSSQGLRVLALCRCERLRYLQ